MPSELFNQALTQGAAGERLSRAEAFALIATTTPATLQATGAAAHANRVRRHGRQATYIFNLHLNPANICGAACSFCDYAATPREAHAYVMTEEEIFAQVRKLQPTEAHITGGLNKVWGYRRNLELVRELRRRHPGLFIKAYTAVEIAYFARTEKMAVEQVLKELLAAGVDALPGGGAEIFSERLWREHWPNKAGPCEWLDIHALAHRQGIPTNATMLFGFGDTWEERVEHMLLLREMQDRSPGFVCFIPLAFQPGKDNFIAQGPTPYVTLRVLALARLILDNIPHLKSYWPMAGLETAAAGLGYGADDLDGTLGEERIAHLAGATTPKGLARERMVETITLAGFEPQERDGRFRPVEAAAAAP